MADNPVQLPHKLTLQDRNRLSMTGVSEVETVEENAVVVRTGLGRLVVQGRQLQLKTLSPEGGKVELEGTVSALYYQQPPSSEGWLRRLLR